MHHIGFRSNGGTDRADNLITVCTYCNTHAAHQPGGILHKWQKKYRKVPFMNTLRRQIFGRHRKAHFTDGSVAAPAGKALGLEKPHVNDAIAITGTGHLAGTVPDHAVIREVHSKKRPLHEVTPGKGRKEKNRTQKREAENTPAKNGFRISDKARAGKKAVCITGLTGNNACTRDAEGSCITQPGKSHRPFRLSDTRKICSDRNWVMM